MANRKACRATCSALTEFEPSETSRARKRRHWKSCWARSAPVAKDLARGIDSRPVEADGEAKSISAESTFESDLTTVPAIERALLAHAERVAPRLTEEGLYCEGVVVKLKYADFSIETRQMRIEPARDIQSIYQAAKELLRRFALTGRRIRLVGVGVKDLHHGNPPGNLFSREEVAKKGALSNVTAAIKQRYGTAGITHAELLSLDDETVPDKERV